MEDTAKGALKTMITCECWIVEKSLKRRKRRRGRRNNNREEKKTASRVIIKVHSSIEERETTE